MANRLEQRQIEMREQAKSEPLRERIRDLGTVCKNCRTAFVPNPDKENTGLCGWCKVKAGKPTIQ